MDSQLIAVVGGPLGKYFLGFIMGRIPERIRPLIPHIASLLVWVIGGYVTDMNIKDTLVNALITSAGAQATHEVWKGTVKGQQ